MKNKVYNSLDVARLKNIPPELAKGKRWVCWKEVVRDGRATKVPVDPHTGRFAESNNPATWGTIAQATAHYRKNPTALKGVGRMFADEDDFMGIDFDDCLTPDGKIDPNHQGAKYLAQLDSYSETSPSGMGIKTWVRSTHRLNNGKGRRSPVLKVEMYRGGRFFTVTGERRPEFSSKVEEHDQAVAALWTDIDGPAKMPEAASKPTEAEKPQSDLFRAMAATMTRIEKSKDRELVLDKLMQGIFEEDQSRADHKLLSKLWFYSGGDRDVVRSIFEQGALADRDKWQARPEYQESSLDAACKGDVWQGKDATQAATTKLEQFSIGELLKEQAIARDWIWEGHLVAGSTNGLAGKKFASKSTVARNLLLAVSRGDPFLGCATKKGRVLYLPIEDGRAHAVTELCLMGATDADDIHIADRAEIPQVLAAMRETNPVLMVVDTLIRLTKTSPEKANYEAYNSVLGEIDTLAHELGTCILYTHHSGKEIRELIDSFIGSTGIITTASTLMVVRTKPNGQHTIETQQRVGCNLLETALIFDPATHCIKTGGPQKIVEIDDTASKILAFVKAAGRSVTTAEIHAGTAGQKQKKLNALDRLVQHKFSRPGSGQLVRTGSGKSGDPYLYTVSGTSGTSIGIKNRVPDISQNAKTPMNTGVKSGTHTDTYRYVPDVPDIVKPHPCEMSGTGVARKAMSGTSQNRLAELRKKFGQKRRAA